MCRRKWLQLRPSRMLLHIFLSMLLTHNFFLLLILLPLHSFQDETIIFIFFFIPKQIIINCHFGAVCDEIRMTFMSSPRKILKCSPLCSASASLLISMECSFHIFVSLHDDVVELLLQQCFVVKWRVLKWMGE